ncbi:hypothetical protein AB0I53_30895 [Saccharopolyspora sp. NPDC050389]|uniref:hypothetical protein n=1 Tax=Saccharopolyspora sp. NPDC050389 TaxID=3155516 RepID=UPI0033C51E98
MTAIAVLNHRQLAMLRAVAGGRAEITCSCEPDLYVDGLPCCDQGSARELVQTGLLRAAPPGARGRRVAAALTDLGRAALR